MRSTLCQRFSTAGLAKLRFTIVGMSLRIEFDFANKILLIRVDGQLTNEAATELYKAIRTYSVATDASAGIWDLTAVTEFPVSTAHVRNLASQGAAMPQGDTRPRFWVVPNVAGYGLARMAGIMLDSTNPLLQVVRSMDEALAALGVKSPHFEPLV
jgi:hypothetical protein